MSQVYLLCVGKLKDPPLQELAQKFLKRIKWPKLEIIEVKASAESPQEEMRYLDEKIKQLAPKGCILIPMCEQGQQYNSCEFAHFLERNWQAARPIIFTIAGAQGYEDSFLKRADTLLSLSALTFPHQIARVLFIEQYYRAQTILNKHPYHN